MRVRRLPADDVSLIATIDRSEHVDVQYGVIDGRLTEQPVAMTEIPTWDPTGSGPYSVAAQVDFCASLIADGAVLLGTFNDKRAVGRRGAARALWGAAVDLALAAGAESIYVSAVPTGSAVGFYLRQGCRLADPVHPALFAKEPDDIHLVRSLP